MQEHRKHRVYRRQGMTTGNQSCCLFSLGASAAGLMATMIYKKKHGKTEKADEKKRRVGCGFCR